MKRYIYFLFIALTFVFSGCSSDNDSVIENPTPQESDYFRMNVSGADIQFGLDGTSNAGLNRAEDVFEIQARYGIGISETDFTFRFDKSGHAIDVTLKSNDTEYAISVDYGNYTNFRQNYFDVQIVSLDEVQKRLKASFSGRVYMNRLDFNSEFMEISGTFELPYGDFLPSPGITYSSLPLKCYAKINGSDWNATHQSTPESNAPAIFTSFDPYRIDVFIKVNNSATAEYNITPESQDNYIRFYKFNTVTLLYDEYDVTGTMDYHLKEFYGGGNRYRYFGSFNFTAINPQNPADIIQITDGDFISFQG
jgi:hypothetical protein